MRKLIILILTLALIGSLSCGAAAAQAQLVMSDANGQNGQTVYLSVSLNETVRGDSMAVFYSYDANVLEAVPSSCTWSQEGVLKDFDSNNAGVWATSSVQDINGRICVLAFNVRSGVKLTETKVSCTLKVKNGSADAGEFTAEATISAACDHDFGDWEDDGALGHSHTCRICKAQQTQSHSWDDGVVAESQKNPDVSFKTYTCTVCGGTKSIQVETEDENVPEIPEITAPPATTPTTPTAPQYSGTQGQTNPNNTLPTVSSNQGNNGNAQNNSSNQNVGQPTIPPGQTIVGSTFPTDGQDHIHADGENHNIVVAETTPLIVKSANEPTEHDHTHETQAAVSQEERSFNMVLTLVVVAAMVAAGVYFMKKKK